MKGSIPKQTPSDSSPSFLFLPLPRIPNPCSPRALLAAQEAIQSSLYAFAALRRDGRVVAWGDPASGGDPEVEGGSELGGSVEDGGGQLGMVCGGGGVAV